MVMKIGFLVAEILVFLIVLQRGYLLPILESIDFPYYDLCWNFVEKFYYNNTSSSPQAQLQNAGKDLWESLFTLLLYLFMYPLISKATHMFWNVGKYERISPAGRLFSQVAEILSNMFLTAVVVGLVQQTVLNRIYSGIGPYTILKVILGIGAPLLLIVLLFFVVGVPFLTFLGWLLIRVGISSSLKFITIELFLMNAYFLLNIPGVMEETGAIVLTIAGMIMCIGAACGTAFLDNKADEYIEQRGARNSLFGVF